MIVKRRKSLALLALLAAGAVPYVSSAQVNGTWLSRYSGTWTTATNWGSNPFFPSSGGTAMFPSNGWGPVSVIVPINPVTLSRIVIDGPSLYNLTDQDAFVFNGPAILDVNGPTGSYAWLSAFSNANTISRIKTSSGLIKNGNGNLTSAILNNVTGGITINGGTFVTGGNYPIFSSNGTLTLNGGALRETGFGLGSTVMMSIGAGGGTIAFDTSVMTYGGNISGSSTLNLLRGPAGGMQVKTPLDFSGWVNVSSYLDLIANGAMTNASGFTVTDTLFIDGISSGTFNRVSDTAPIHLRGGTIQGSGTLSQPGTETLGAVTLEDGLNVIGSNSTLGLELAILTHTGHSALSLGTTSFSLRVTGTAPALSGSGSAGSSEVGVLPWAHGVSSASPAISPLTVDDGVIRALASAEFTSTVPSSITASNLKLAADASMSTPGTVNSLTVVPAVSSVNFSGNGMLTITSGGLFAQGSTGSTTTSIGVPIDFGSAEGFLHTSTVGSSGTVLITGPISGSGGVNVAGTVTLRGNSTYTGQTTINGRVLIADNVHSGSPGPLGADTLPVVINSQNTGAITSTPPAWGITLYPQPNGTILFDRDLIINSSNPLAADVIALGSLSGGSGSAVVSSNIQLNGALTLAGSAKPGAAGFIISGNITGPGMLMNPSNVTISGDNSFTGGVVLSGSQVVIGSSHAFGTGTIWMTNIDITPLSATSPVTLNNPIVMSSPLQINGNQPITLAGPIDLYSGSRVITLLTSNTTATITGDISNGSLTKMGNGLLEVRRLRLPKLTVTLGTVRVLPDGTSSSTSILQNWSIAASTVSQFDLTNNNLIIDYSNSVGTMLTQMQSDLQNARLATSMNTDGHALGFADNASLGLSSFSGQVIDPTSILVRYTYSGDANLDGIVNAADLTSLSAHWQQNSQTWLTGDFNYDGTVNITDLYLLVVNWGRGGTVTASLASELAGLNLPDIFVPEPGATPFVMAGLAWFSGRRNCRYLPVKMRRR